MANKTLKILASLALVTALGLAPACAKTAATPAQVNENVIAFWGFNLDAASVNLATQTIGAIFAKSSGDNKDGRKVVISARLSIDVADWAGVSFSIPAGWEVSSVTTDYPQGSSNPQNHTTIIYTGSMQEEFQRVVEIGNTKHGAAEPQGGTGSVIIELVPMPDNKDSDTLEIGIAVGSSGEDIAGPVHGRFKVTFD